MRISYATDQEFLLMMEMLL